MSGDVVGSPVEQGVLRNVGLAVEILVLTHSYVEIYGLEMFLPGGKGSFPFSGSSLFLFF